MRLDKGHDLRVVHPDARIAMTRVGIQPSSSATISRSKTMVRNGRLQSTILPSSLAELEADKLPERIGVERRGGGVTELLELRAVEACAADSFLGHQWISPPSASACPPSTIRFRIAAIGTP